jgi:hypothetical protein
MEAKVLSNANRSASQSWQGSVMAELVRAEIASTGAGGGLRFRCAAGCALVAWALLKASGRVRGHDS